MTIYQQIYNKIISELKSGTLKPGQKLPSIRKYASENGISCNSVQTAYNQLLEEGYITAREKSGYYAADFEEVIFPVLHEKDKKNLKPADSGKRIIKNEPSSKSPVEQKKDSQELNGINLSANQIDSAFFPYTTLRHLYREVLSGKNNEILEHTGDFCGDEDFRNSIAAYLFNHRGVKCNSSQIIIGGGTSSLLQQIIKLFTLIQAGPQTGSQTESQPDPQSSTQLLSFVMETPCYNKIQKTVRDTGCTIIPVTLDENGASIQEIRKHTKSIQNLTLLHLTPSHQFPLGITMTAPRRNAILKWAYEKENRFIIEDDYDSDFRYKGYPIPPLQSMDINEKVIYLGTFSRTLTPSLRISYAVLPEKLAELYRNNFNYFTCPVSRIDQKVISLFINEGYYQRHINRAKKVYKERRDFFINLLTDKIPALKLSGTEAGLHFTIDAIDEARLIMEAEKMNLSLQGTGTGKIIIGYAHLSHEEIKKSADILSQLKKYIL